MSFPDVVGPDGRRQTVNILVSQFRDLINIIKASRRQNWPKVFFLGNLHVVVSAAKDLWLDEISVITIHCSAFASSQQLGAFPLSRLDVSQHRVHLLFAD